MSQTWEERLRNWRNLVVHRSPEPIRPGCCAMSGLVVEWMEASGRGPTRTGWAVSYDLTHFVNVAYCPFCGSKLP